MSRKGKIPVEIPKEVKVSIETYSVKVEGPKGKLDLDIPYGISVKSVDAALDVTRISNAKQNRANHGTIRACLANMVVGVTAGHKKELEIQGLGFRVQLKGKTLVFNLGLSHSVEFEVPAELSVTVSTSTSIQIEGPDKVLVGEISARIRSIKPVEPYKGKGIRYLGEVVQRKQGKSVTK